MFDTIKGAKAATSDATWPAYDYFFSCVQIAS